MDHLKQPQAVLAPTDLLDDLATEQASFEAMLLGLSETDWSRDTPAEGWTIRHQVVHILYFDRMAALSAADPDAFAVERPKAASPSYSASVLVPFLDRPGAELLDEWTSARRSFADTMRRTPPEARLQWYGPPMSARSMITARLMETWAHGQDVADALGIRREPSDRLRHVLHIGYRARAFSYANRQLPIPAEDVHVAVTGPSGDVWTFGDPTSEVKVTGSAEELALVLTRRRHRSDTDLITVGPAAAEWLEIGQTYAGSPGTGRRPGQFPRRH